MEKWIRLGSEVYAADHAVNGFVKIGGYTFLGPVAQLEGGAYGGNALRFHGIEGTAPADNGLTEGWLAFGDGEFPEVKLITVLQAADGRARMRHVLSGEGTLCGDASLTLTALLLRTEPRLYAVEDGALVAVSAEDGILECSTLIAESEEGAVMISGGDFFAVAKDEEGFCLATGVELEQAAELTGEGYTSPWVEIAMGRDAEALLDGE